MPFKRILLAVFLLALPFVLPAQLMDDFNDGDFTTGMATWGGNVADFEVDNGRLQLQDTATATTFAYLSSGFGNLLFTDTITWEFEFQVLFNPSTSNQPRIYLVSDNPDLTAGLSGYHLRIGASGALDPIEFWRQTGTTTGSKIGDCTGASYGTTPHARIRVTRYPGGTWFIEADSTGGTNFAPEGTFVDNSVTSGSYFGFHCRYTTSNDTNFYFDNVNVQGNIFVDQTPPQLTSVTVEGPDSLTVQFDENVDLTTSQNVGNYVVLGFGSPNVASRNGVDFSKVGLKFINPFQNLQTYDLKVCGVKDLAPVPNTMVCDTLPFSYFVPAAAVAGDVIFNEIYFDQGGVDPIVQDEYIELFNISQKAIDLKDWVFQDSTSSGYNPTVITTSTYLMLPGDYLVLTANPSLHAAGGYPVLGIGSITLYDNDGEPLLLMDANGDTIDYVHYDPDLQTLPDHSLELVNPYDTCFKDGEWQTSTNGLGGTPGAVNSVFNPNLPTTPPFLTSCVVGAYIQLCFSGPLDPGFMSNISNYSLSGGILIFTATLSNSNTCVTLNYAGTFIPGITYTLTMDSLVDCYGNIGTGVTKSLGQGAMPAAGQLIINEIYAVGSSSYPANIPQIEWIELYNNSNLLLDLSTVTFYDGAFDDFTFSAGQTLAPYDYVVLCDVGHANDFLPYGNGYAIEGSLPSLSNSGECLQISDSTGGIVDRVCYNTDIYGGTVNYHRTLERVDTAFSCQDDANWRLSVADSGGTPGAINSVLGNIVNQERPEVFRAEVLSTSKIRVWFTEQMDVQELGNTANYFISEGINQPDSALPVYPDLLAVDLVFSPQMAQNVVYNVVVDTVLTDCPGLNLTTNNIAYFGIPFFPQPGDLVINEILFNPVTGGSDYVELYNLSTTRIFDLRDLRIGEIYPETDSVFNSDHITESSYLLLPLSYVCLTPNKQFQLDQYFPIDPKAIFEMSSFPSYDDSEGECVIFTDSSFIDRLHYYSDWHYPDLDDKNGVSLERLSFTDLTQDQNNWHSAASVVHYGTPGYKNSQLFIPNPEPGEVTIQPEVFSPDGDGIDDFVAINYQFDISYNAKVSIFDHRGRLVNILVENTLLGTDAGFFTWYGTDEAGKKADIGIYVIMIELTHPDGQKRLIKKSVVLGGKI
ncbi:MAG: lamin tail domain-containing protein [Bacteroidia bacterium]|nr:lamin tail domain-containing protein [Bacteroidia bacterium]